MHAYEVDASAPAALAAAAATLLLLPLLLANTASVKAWSLRLYASNACACPLTTRQAPHTSA